MTIEEEEEVAENENSTESPPSVYVTVLYTAAAAVAVG